MAVRIRSSQSVQAALSRNAADSWGNRTVTELDVRLVYELTELHDTVMQRVYATGLGLQALMTDVSDPVLAARLRRHIADLDETLREIRTALFALREEWAQTL
jgi:hypothetical protein